MTSACDETGRRHIAVGVVIYRPERTLLSRLQLALDSGFDIYVFDNSPEHGEVRSFCKAGANCSYATVGKNMGLGVGISAVCAQAYYDSHSALIFFDQDTVFTEDTLLFIDKFYADNQSLAAEYSAVVFNAKARDTAAGDRDTGLREVLMAISSGSLFFLRNLSRLNWHNERYFVDCVDYEFCLNSSNHNLKIGEWSATPGFDHVSEQPDHQYRLFGRVWSVRKYPTARVRDALTASGRLMLASLVTGNLRFLLAMARSVSIYACFQTIVRLMDLFKARGQTAK